MVNIKEIGEKFKKVLKLDRFPLIIYESNDLPDDATPMCSIDGCVAKSIFLSSTGENDKPGENDKAIYINKKSLKGCCPGSMTYFGFSKPNKYMKYFVSTGKENFRDGEAEYLKRSPEEVEKFLESIGKIKAIENNLIIQKCETLEKEINLDDNDIDIKAILIFGDSEQIRNLANLIFF